MVVVTINVYHFKRLILQRQCRISEINDVKWCETEILWCVSLVSREDLSDRMLREEVNYYFADFVRKDGNPPTLPFTGIKFQNFVNQVFISIKLLNQ